jgi:hypothetical protein
MGPLFNKSETSKWLQTSDKVEYRVTVALTRVPAAYKSVKTLNVKGSISHSPADSLPYVGYTVASQILFVSSIT